MSIALTCSKCGYQFTSTMLNFGSSRHITIENVSESCPKCDARVFTPNGTYSFVGHVVSAFQAPGVSRDSIEKFQDIAKGVESGTINREQASIDIQELNSEFANIWNWSNKNSGAISILLAIIGIYLAISSGWGADESAEKQLESTRSVEKVQQKILKELQKQTAAVSMPVELTPSRPQSKPKPRVQKPDTVSSANRRDRRAAAAKARRQTRD